MIVTWDGLLWRLGSDNSTQIAQLHMNEQELKSCVYIICMSEGCVINYFGKLSPVLYIGEGNLIVRLREHEKWLRDVPMPMSGIDFKVMVCPPMVQMQRVHRHMEADLLDHFSQRYSCLPLMNRQYETRKIHLKYGGEFTKPLDELSYEKVRWIFHRPASSRTSKSSFMKR